MPQKMDIMSWICHGCLTVNIKARCSLCSSWKGGWRYNFSKKQNNNGVSTNSDQWWVNGCGRLMATVHKEVLTKVRLYISTRHAYRYLTSFNLQYLVIMRTVLCGNVSGCLEYGFAICNACLQFLECKLYFSAVCFVSMPENPFLWCTATLRHTMVTLIVKN